MGGRPKLEVCTCSNPAPGSVGHPKRVPPCLIMVWGILLGTHLFWVSSRWGVCESIAAPRPVRFYPCPNPLHLLKPRARVRRPPEERPALFLFHKVEASRRQGLEARHATEANFAWESEAWGISGGETMMCHPVQARKSYRSALGPLGPLKGSDAAPGSVGHPERVPPCFMVARRIFIELVTSGRKLEASREGSKQRIYGALKT